MKVLLALAVTLFVIGFVFCQPCYNGSKWERFWLALCGLGIVLFMLTALLRLWMWALL